MTKAYILPREKEQFGNYFFEDIAEWIADSLDPDQVYDAEVLVKFVIDNFLDDVLQELSEQGFINESDDGGFDPVK